MHRLATFARKLKGDDCCTRFAMPEITARCHGEIYPHAIRRASFLIKYT